MRKSEEEQGSFCSFLAIRRARFQPASSPPTQSGASGVPFLLISSHARLSVVSLPPRKPTVPLPTKKNTARGASGYYNYGKTVTVFFIFRVFYLLSFPPALRVVASSNSSPYKGAVQTTDLPCRQGEPNLPYSLPRPSILSPCHHMPLSPPLSCSIGKAIPEPWVVGIATALTPAFLGLPLLYIENFQACTRPLQSSNPPRYPSNASLLAIFPIDARPPAPRPSPSTAIPT